MAGLPHAIAAPAGQAGGALRGPGSLALPRSTEPHCGAVRSHDRPWIAIHHRADDGARVRSAVRAEGWVVHWPRYILRRPRLDDTLKPLIPGYLFATPSDHARPWPVLTQVANVIAILGARVNGEPLLVPPPWVEALISEAGGIDGVLDRTEDAAQLKPGQRVRITTGPLAGFSGLFAADAGKARVKVLLALMGSTPAEVDRDAVEAIQ